MSQSEKLNLIYENIEVLVSDKNYIVLPNEVFRFTKLLANEGVTSYDRLMVGWDILTYKHDEKNPFPSHEKLAKAFGVGKRAITNAVSELVKVGLFINEKGKYGTDKRKNTYNVSPLLNMLACFVEAVREGRDVCIKELYENVVRGNLKARKVSKQEEAPKEEKVGFSEAINSALSNVNETRRQALNNIIQKHVDRLDEETIIFYINRVDEKCNNESKFYNFASMCFRNANNGDKQKEEQTPKQESKKPYTGKQKPVRVEKLPKWYDEQKEREKAVDEYRSQFSYKELEERKKHDKAIEEKADAFVKDLFTKETGKDKGSNILEYLNWIGEKYDAIKDEYATAKGNMNVSIYNSIHKEDMLEYKLVM